MNIEYTNKTATSTIELEDYFPLTVNFHDVPDLVRHYQIYNADTDMLEFETDYETGLNLRMKLLLCNHVGLLDRPVSIPSASAGELVFSGADLFESDSAELLTDIFLLNICTDGVELTLGEGEPDVYVRSGSVTFGLDGSNRVTRIIVSGMTANEISHLREEIQAR